MVDGRRPAAQAGLYKLIVDTLNAAIEFLIRHNYDARLVTRWETNLLWRPGIQLNEQDKQTVMNLQIYICPSEYIAINTLHSSVYGLTALFKKAGNKSDCWYKFLL